MKIVEFYSGTQGISNEFRKNGHTVLSIELNHKFTEEPYNLKQWTVSIADVTVKEIVRRLGGYPDIIWASPLCTTHSIAAISTHRTFVDGFGNTQKKRKETHMLIAKSEKAKLHDQLLLKTLLLIRELHPKYYFIENPRGGMRYSPIMIGVMYRYTVTYCKYGDLSMKPTDIWTNHPNPDFKPMCWNGNKNCHHQSAPRGSKTGTQGKKGNIERSMIPKKLCEHIVKISEM